MRTIGHDQKIGIAALGMSVRVKWLILMAELGLVILIAYQLAQVTFVLLEDETGWPITERQVSAAGDNETDMSRLTGFDPFYRQITDVDAPEEAAAIPESDLKIVVFGLRAGAEGQGSAIIKMQGDDDQKLVRVGDQMSSGVTLAGVYPDRLEVRRRGSREAIYLRPQTERTAPTAAPVRPATGVDRRESPERPATNAPSNLASYSPGAARIMSAIKGLALSPVRRSGRIVGFRMPDSVPPMVAALGLESGDILMKANGSSLASFERIEELGEELSGATRLELEIERRGQTIVKAIDLR